MISMPLIDEPDTLLDRELMAKIADHYTTREGMIIDGDGNCWYNWRSDGLDSWWRFFEEIIDNPMGRRLANAACDEEEWLLNSQDLDFTGFFRKKKARSAIIERWQLNGWGMPSLNPPGFDSVGLTPVFSGILQADIERINSQRYRMLWEEKSAQATTLTLNSSNLPVSPSKKSIDSYESGLPLKIDLESGWKIDGIRHFLLPVGLFKRLEESCNGLVANISEDERNSWPDCGDGFLAMALAAKKLFIAGEELFLAADEEGWIDSCNAYFSPRGLSLPISVKMVDTNGGIELKFSKIPLLSLTVGFLAGAWVRCEGRPVNVEVKSDEKYSIVILKSRYEIS